MQKTNLKNRLRNSLKYNDEASVPILLYPLSLFVCGALYTLFFIEVAYPSLMYLIPASTSKTFIMMLMYAIPLFILIVLTIAFVKSGLEQRYYEQMFRR